MLISGTLFFYENVLNPISFEQVGSVERKGESLGREVI